MGEIPCTYREASVAPRLELWNSGPERNPPLWSDRDAVLQRTSPRRPDTQNTTTSRGPSEEVQDEQLMLHGWLGLMGEMDGRDNTQSFAARCKGRLRHLKPTTHPSLLAHPPAVVAVMLKNTTGSADGGGGEEV
ncbi:hypothetical protein CSOJ01_13110 [Colletotrichum sojae]|uniref:Uncharacterized protein n=1 Tax=Colletotrichum sojae TaxID=2175907 RepID=A0A8H6MKZ7_9PEZI|nr:hypothetical protein CSOJ01_13110 [Colletotrichum sojae]